MNRSPVLTPPDVRWGPEVNRSPVLTPPDVTSREEGVPGSMSRGFGGSCPMSSDALWVMVTWGWGPPGQNDWQTDTTESITSP